MPDEPSPPPRRIDPLLPSVGFGLSLIGAIGAHLASGGVPLGTPIGSLAFSAVIAPPLVAGARDTVSTTAIAIACALGAMVVSYGSPSFGEVSLVHLTLSLALAGAVRLLVQIHINRAIAGTLVTVLAFAWLSWPIWLSHRLSGDVSLLVTSHPIFTINGVLPPGSPDWVHLPLMYRLTTLGQDVPFTMPTSVWPCALTHFGIAVATLSASTFLEMRSARRQLQREDVGPSGQ